MSALRLILAGLTAGILAATGVGLLLLALVSTPPPGDSGASASATASPSLLPSPETSAPPPSETAPATATPGPFGVGLAAPGLRLEQLGGGTVDLAALRGHPVWVVFTATWCPSCLDDAAAMSSFAARYGGSGLVVVAVDVREDEGTVAAFASSSDSTYPIALDPDGSAARTWGVLALPTHFFLDAEGIVRAGATGTIGRDLMASSLGRILPGVDVTP